ncbi:zinc carboxypeptidase [Phialemonium atrogriseum]|uniref:Zinc carboxypeptidase n=1 Tax=Phialemonium atrogriseum TaxID=1093897 RepID=A0AAJ0C4T0_9PEZI|nr:zinc carboxypeptidase [Phialemonium atrogriseum]KAK1770165.1 zinc carboxypeptidase [Phialemonium atrogriseum]
MKPVPAISLFLAFSSAAVVQPRRVSYDGYKVLRLAVGEEAEKLNGIVSRLNLPTWKGAPRAGAFADIVVPPAQFEEFSKVVVGMDAIVMHEDLGASIAAESAFNFYAAGSANQTWFNSYHSYSDHLQFLNDLQQQYPSNSEIVTAGNSLNGNAITGIHLFGSSGKGVKPAVVFHGTVHAREWIATMVVEYLGFNLLTNYNSSDEIQGFMDKYDFYAFPVVNPDGFIYTQTTDRLWRKNRQANTGSSCTGRDINRNWPYQWSVPGGASTNPCAEDYKGKDQSDAPETTALSSWLQKTKDAQGLKLYIDYHSYSQLFMTPYGYSCTALATNNDELQSLAAGAVAAIRAVHGVRFDYGPICSTIYQATGSSVDYAADVVGADYTFTSELRDTGAYGFVLPAAQILPSGEEAFAGVGYLLANMK